MEFVPLSDTTLRLLAMDDPWLVPCSREWSRRTDYLVVLPERLAPRTLSIPIPPMNRVAIG